MTRLTYWIYYPGHDNPVDALFDTDVGCISKSRKRVNQNYNESLAESEYLQDLFHRINTFNSINKITGDSVWVMFEYDFEAPDTADVVFTGNDLQECLLWWSKHWKEYVNDENLVSEIPSFEHFTGEEDLVWESYKHGVRIKKMQLI